MPTLKQITASLELGPNGAKLKEYGHRYTDGGVEAFIAVPETDLPFHIHVTSSGYIAPGLAAYVYMDGEYQCNRNRQRLQIPAPGMASKEFEVDFNMRQKEEKSADGLFVAREWTFSTLKTANADRAPPANPHFSRNVGTIEIVVLRCKDDGPARTTIAPFGAPTIQDVSTQPVPKSEAAAPAKAPFKPPSRAPSKAAPKAASKAASNKASEAGSGGFGGMFGIFDGAGDAPDYYDEPRYRTRHDRDPYSPRPFMAHDARDHVDESPRFRQPPVYNRTPMQYPARHAEPITPRADYDFRQRRRMPQAQAQASPLTQTRDRYRDHPYEREDSEISRQRGDGARSRELEGFEFVRHMSKQVEAVWKLSFKERQKAAELYREAQQCQDDPELHFAAMKALRQREQEMDKLGDESAVLLGSIFARMRRMDQRTWSHCRDYLIFERRLVPVDHLQMQEWPNPKLPRPMQPQPPRGSKSAVSAPPQAAQENAWQEIGEGATGEGGGGLYERKVQQSGRASQHGKATPQKPEAEGWGADGGQKEPEAPGIGGWDAGDDIDNHADKNNNADDQWGANGDDGGNKKGGDGWGGGHAGADNDQGRGDWNNADNNNEQQGDAWNTPGENKSQSKDANAWGDNDAAGQPAADGGDDWGGDAQQNEPKPASNNQWANNNDQQQGGGGGAWGDTKSQGHQSKVKTWDDGNRQNPKSKAGWDQGPVSKSRASLPSRQRGGDGSSSERLEPVIKPYWAQWDQPRQEVQKPRVRARDAYEFPAPPTVIAPTEKPSSISYGIQPGRGAKYTHDTYRPEYLDTMEKPYAIFTFKYRSKKALESILKRKIDTSEAQRAIEEAEREHLMRLPKDEIVQEMMKMKLAAGKGPAHYSEKPASNPGWMGANADDRLRPDDSVSRRDWSRKSQKKAPMAKSNGGAGWPAQGNNENNAGDWNKAPSQNAKAEAGDGWGNADHNNGNGGGDGWGGAAPAGPTGGWQEDKPQSNHTPELFKDDPGLQEAGGKAASDKTQPRDQGWAEAGW